MILHLRLLGGHSADSQTVHPCSHILDPPVPLLRLLRQRPIADDQLSNDYAFFNYLRNHLLIRLEISRADYSVHWKLGGPSTKGMLGEFVWSGRVL